MVGNNHNWDVETDFWISGRHSCATLGNLARGFAIVPKRDGFDWDEFYRVIGEKYGDDLYRFATREEAISAFYILSEGLT